MVGVQAAEKKQVLPASWVVSFLGVLTPRDIVEGPFEVYTNFKRFQTFRLNEEQAGFPGAIGIREQLMSDEEEKKIELCLWPCVPARDTLEGQLDISDPEEVLDISWFLVKGAPGTMHPPILDGFRVRTIAFKMKAGNIHWEAVTYAWRLLARTRKVWARSAPRKDA